MKSKKRKKVLIGPLPPPLGGVANHIYRYSQKHNLNVIPENTIRVIKNTKKTLMLKDSAIYVHSGSWYISLILLVKATCFNRNCEYYLVNHNFSVLTSPSRGIKSSIQQLFRYIFVHRCKTVYVVNPSLIAKMKEVYGNLKYEILNPFVPPCLTTEGTITNSYNATIFKFLESHSPIICSGAWQLSTYEGEDLYGLDLLIEMMAALKFKLDHIGLIFFLGNPQYNSDYLFDCEERIRKLGLSNKIYIEKGQKEMWPIIKRSDLFIRATNTDGDSLSIKEALFFGVKVLASDCTKRAEQVYLFKSREKESLITETLKILN